MNVVDDINQARHAQEGGSGQERQLPGLIEVELVGKKQRRKVKGVFNPLLRPKQPDPVIHGIPASFLFRNPPISAIKSAHKQAKRVRAMQKNILETLMGAVVLLVAVTFL